jgi:1-acyl-sn-glycerol-3-phosphate acyltransferase
MDGTDYDDIRPYYDYEAPEKIRLLLADPAFSAVLKMLFPDSQAEEKVRNLLLEVKTIEQLQSSFIYHFVGRIISNTTKGITTSGLENLDKKKAYLFISNHRDIILDSAFLNFVVHQNGMNTTQIAIGDNLLIYDWITHLVKLNRAFVVKRNIAARELLEASKKLSSYIRSSIIDKNISVWLAQREGRTKDGNDLTQIALLKMLNLSNNKRMAEGFGELTIIPLSISYEIEPCGISKVAELIRKHTDGYQKTPADDLKSMASGLTSMKGRVHFSFGRPVLMSFLEGIDQMPLNDFVQQLATRIDHRIHQYYKLWPFNYVAYDLMNGTGEFTENYTSQDIIEFKKMIAEAKESVQYKGEEVARKFSHMYAMPVENSIIAAEVFRS